MEGLGSLIFLALLLGVFYFILIRPQKKRVESHRNLVMSIEEGDEIVTIGGIHGTVHSLDEDGFDLEVASGVVMRFVKSAVAKKVTEDIDEDIDESLETTED